MHTMLAAPSGLARLHVRQWIRSRVPLARRRAAAEAGVVSLEMALVTPVVLLTLVASVLLGHALYVRFLLTGMAQDSARLCALGRTPAAECAAAVRQRAAQEVPWCQPLEVEATLVQLPLAGSNRVQGLALTLQCHYVGGIGLEFLARNKISIADLRASALVPL
jgi:hypothetical protein